MNELLAEITWRPSIGDPDPLGWTITIAYLVAGWFCVSAGRNELDKSARDGRKRLPWFWFAMAALMFGLGLNKQLDLQVLLAQWGRQVARNGGWLEYRRWVQAIFVVIGAGIGLAWLIASYYLIRHRWRQYAVTYTGAVLLLAFVVMRAAYLSNVSRLLDRIPELIQWINSGLELGGTILVGLGALMNARRTK
jgi:hypothetical protein